MARLRTSAKVAHCDTLMRYCDWCKEALPKEVHFNTKFHPDCRKESDRRKKRDWEREKHGYVRHPKCDWCGGSIPDSAPYSWKLCGDECRKELREFHFKAARERNRKIFNTECAECGRSLPGDADAKAKYCSEDCRRAVKSRRFKEFYRAHPQRYQDYSAIRRANLKSVTVEKVDRAAVFDRDGWVCHICNDPISKDEAWPSPGSVSLDHVIPISKGGEHSYANCKAAHWGCNASKGDSVAE